MRPARSRLPHRHFFVRRQRAVRRARLCPPRPGHEAGPPRRLAVQRDALLYRRREAHRFRPGQVEQQAGRDRHRHQLGKDRLHVAGAAPGPRGRPPQRPVFGRPHPVGAADRAAALSRPRVPRRPAGDPAPLAFQPQHPSRSRGGRPQNTVRGSRSPLPDRRRDERRSRRAHAARGGQARPGRLHGGPVRERRSRGGCRA